MNYWPKKGNMMKKSIKFYLKNGVKPEGYGFVWLERDGGWKYQIKGSHTALYIDPHTRQITANGGYSTPLIAKMVEIAANGNIITDELDDERPYLMRLNEEEVRAINKMRGHPESGEIYGD